MSKFFDILVLGALCMYVGDFYITGCEAALTKTVGSRVMRDIPEDGKYNDRKILYISQFCCCSLLNCER